MDIKNAFSLEGKVALVTGGTYGIGFAIGSALAQAGAKVVYNCRSEKSMNEGIKNYAAAGITEAYGYYCDVTKEEDIVALVQKIEEDLGGVDIPVNNAGIIKRIPMIEMSSEASNFVNGHVLYVDGGILAYIGKQP